ncbi:MAG: ABC transporter ATP-binding protein [Candidatus Heimdallarchaeota archaeon]|nr:MAG: ABC transporter ATP-binding protein [Candidatus Heimdallarchaeota archaeon]
MIELQEVSKSFGDVVALSRLTMSATDGQVTGFLGPNGAGKSTTLKLIMGEIRPDIGDVSVFDEDPFNNALLKKRIGYVSEHDDLYPWMKGKQFVRSLARLVLPREQAETAAKEALSKVGLGVKGKRIGAYSKGMKQRLKVAAGIAHHPDLLILDEPFGGLDPLGRREMKQLVSELNQQGVTVLISSHILYELDEMSTRMVLIHRGQALAEGPPTEILNLIDQFPHQILFQAPPTELHTLSKLLIEEDIVKSITFNKEKEREDLVVITETPTTFYPVATRIIAENGLLIKHLESQTDNIEAIFDYLT